MRVLLALLLLLCLPATSFAIPTTSDALEIKLISERYHIELGYELSGYDPVGDTFLLFQESYARTGVSPLSYSIGDPPNIPSNFGSSSAGRFGVFTDASSGTYDGFVVDGTFVGVEGGVNQAYAFSEATWAFEIPVIGDHSVPIDYYGNINYFELWDEVTLQVSLAKNGDPAFSQSLFSNNSPTLGTLMLDFMENAPGDRWDLTFKAGYLVYDNDEQHLRISTNLRPVPEPTTLLLLGSGLIGMVALRRKLKI
jgi:hypothetical protein